MRSKILATALGFAFAAALAANPALAGGDAAKGKKVFNKCKACHTLKAGKHKIGPSLAGVIGREAGTADGFKKYSKAMKGSGLVWDEETLSTFLEKPKAMVKGTKMTFGGLKKEGDRENVIAYIMENAE
jgi:cytochrome c